MKTGYIINHSKSITAEILNQTMSDVLIRNGFFAIKENRGEEYLIMCFSRDNKEQILTKLMNFYESVTIDHHPSKPRKSVTDNLKELEKEIPILKGKEFADSVKIVKEFIKDISKEIPNSISLSPEARSLISGKQAMPGRYGDDGSESFASK